MKTALLAALSLSLFTAAAQAQAQDSTFQKRVSPRRAQAQTFTAEARTDGVIPRAARSSNPFQMINIMASPEYGSGQEVVRHEDADPYQNPRGIKLVTIEF